MGKNYRCPHCLGPASQAAFSQGRISCDGDKECCFEGTEEDFEIVGDEGFPEYSERKIGTISITSTNCLFCGTVLDGVSREKLIEHAMSCGKHPLSAANKEIKELKANNESLLGACKAAYRKHHMSDDFIGWEELSDILLDALCNTMGVDGYQGWLDSLSGD